MAPGGMFAARLAAGALPPWHESRAATDIYKGSGLSPAEGYRKPPATRNVSPVIQAASSEARKTAAGATSSVWPIRPSGVCASSCLRKSQTPLGRIGQTEDV